MNKVFLDTNIILDMLDTGRTHHNEARKLFGKLINDEHHVIISEDMLSTIFYVIKNKQAVLQFFKLITRQWGVISFGKATIDSAIDYCLENKNADFEDALQCFCAKDARCDFLITRDKQFPDCGMAVLSVHDFLAKI